MYSYNIVSISVSGRASLVRGALRSLVAQEADEKRYKYIYIYIYIYIIILYICVCIHIYIYIYKKRRRERRMEYSYFSGTEPGSGDRPRSARHICVHVCVYIEACMLSRLASLFQPSQRLHKSLGVQKSMFVCMYIYIYIYTHTYIRIHIHIHIYTQIRMYVFIYIFVLSKGSVSVQIGWPRRETKEAILHMIKINEKKKTTWNTYKNSMSNGSNM